MRMGNGVLPPEVLGEIFNLSLPDTPSVFSRRSLIDLCLVCKDWRDAAHLDGRLWSGINLEFTSKTQPFCYSKALAWIKRSGGRPKSLAIVTACRNHTINNCASSTCSASNRALAQFLIHVPALEHLSLEVKAAQCFRNLCASMKRYAEEVDPSPRSLDSSEFPVKSLSLHVGLFTPQDPGHPTYMFESLPGISNLQIKFPTIHSENDFLHVFDPSPAVPGRRLLSPNILEPITRLSMGCNWPLQDVAAVLESCMNIKELILDLDNLECDDPGGLLHERGISLPKVRVLRLRNIAPFSLQILNFLRLQSISELDVKFGSPGMVYRQILDTQYHTEPWEMFMREHAGTLRILRMEDVSVPEAQRLSMIPANLPLLEHLVLDRVYFNADIFHYWSSTPPTEEEGGMWFPRLKSLELLRLGTGFDPDEVLAYLRTRRPFHEEITGIGEERAVRPVFHGPPDSIQHLVMTYDRAESRGMGRSWEYSEKVLGIARALRRAGILVSLGPKFTRR
ncbi:hypothetical protein D9611_009541 [Ephemerocybe angulata]|uniref:F-box domain-containing protein n=1 Tax=Ephemerocybe angulata TaxID=980116 RepID=A0A8H5AVL9_9AGAR|nr:hypothetical protein D9611_009541 [Tulosesus angulatus]